MGKAIGLAALVGMLGCADFRTQVPVSWYIIESGKSVEIEDADRHVILKYEAPASGDLGMDDTVSVRCADNFCLPETIGFKVGGSGKFYVFGLLFEYNVENDNDGDAANNVLGFSARRW